MANLLTLRNVEIRTPDGGDFIADTLVISTAEISYAFAKRVGETPDAQPENGKRFVIRLKDGTVVEGNLEENERLRFVLGLG